MAAFTDEEMNQQGLDWQILRDGGVYLYLRMATVQADQDRLRTQGYDIRRMDSCTWASEQQMHAALASTLFFPSYYGKNLDALDDCMLEDLNVPISGGLALVLTRYDLFARASNAAHGVLDIFARASRRHMLTGRRLVVLVQSDDPRIKFNELGGVSAQWNRAEWLTMSRGL